MLEFVLFLLLIIDDLLGFIIEELLAAWKIYSSFYSYIWFVDSGAVELFMIYVTPFFYWKFGNLELIFDILFLF